MGCDDVSGVYTYSAFSSRTRASYDLVKQFYFVTVQQTKFIETVLEADPVSQSRVFLSVSCDSAEIKICWLYRTVSLHERSRKRECYCACAASCLLPARQPIKASSGSEDLFYFNFINHILVKHEFDRDLAFYKRSLSHSHKLRAVEDTL